MAEWIEQACAARLCRPDPRHRGQYGLLVHPVAKRADPAPGPRPALEIARYDRLTASADATSFPSAPGEALAVLAAVWAATASSRRPARPLRRRFGALAFAHAGFPNDEATVPCECGRWLPKRRCCSRTRLRSVVGRRVTGRRVARLRSARPGAGSEEVP